MNDKIWTFTHENGEEEEFDDPFKMMGRMLDYIEENVQIGWRNK